MPALATSRHRPTAGLAYSSGIFAGTIKQLLPSPATGQISFVVSSRSVTSLSLKVVERCAGLASVSVAETPKKLRIAVSRAGSFSYDRTVAGDHLSIRGHFHGHFAAGTVFDSLVSGGLSCTMIQPGTFSAAH